MTSLASSRSGGQGPSGDPVKVVIVEDELIVALDLRRALTQWGHRIVATMTNGEDCLENLARLNPDLILMDVGLRGALDGIETARRIRARSKVPVILLSAHTDPDTLERAAQAHPSAYLKKPFQEEDLAAAVHDTLQNRTTTPLTTFSPPPVP